MRSTSSELSHGGFIVCSFGGWLCPPGRYKEPVLVSGADGVGTAEVCL